MMNILYFGRLRDLAGRGQEQLALPDHVTNLSTLKDWLNNEHDLHGALQEDCVKTMVNQSLVHDDITLKGDEEVGFLPPVGGG